MMVDGACIAEPPFLWGRQGGCGNGAYATYGDLDPREHLPGVYDRFGSATVVTETLKDLRGIRSIHALNSAHCLLPPGQLQPAPDVGHQWFVPPAGDSAAWAGAEARQGAPSQQQFFAPALHAAPIDNSHAATSWGMHGGNGSHQVLSQFYPGSEQSQSVAACVGGRHPQASGLQQHDLPVDARPEGDAQVLPPKIGTANQFKDSSSYIHASPKSANAQPSEEEEPARRSRGKSGPKTVPSCMPCLVPCRLGCS